MGLDSIELVVEHERYFNISIPDKEAGQIFTVQNFVDCIAKHLHIVSNEKTLQTTVYIAFINHLQALNKINSYININDNIALHINNPKDRFFLKLANNITIKTPKIATSNNTEAGVIYEFKKLINWTPTYIWEDLTVAEYIDATCAINYEQLIKLENIKTKHEIYIVVMGITAKFMGIDVFEIKPEKSFTNDLGID